jgi:hypothetical protein
VVSALHFLVFRRDILTHLTRLEVLRALVGHIPPNPLWAELIWQRHEAMLAQEASRPPAAPTPQMSTAQLPQV